MPDESQAGADQPTTKLQPMEWSEVCEPGSYLHLASGLIARVYPDDVIPGESRGIKVGGGAVVRLLPNPSAPMAALREIALRNGLKVNA